MIQGYLEVVNVDHVIGWAVDEDQPTVPLKVRILLGSRVLGQVAPDIARPDLYRWESGKLGFLLAFDKPLSVPELTAVTAEAGRPDTAQWQILPRVMAIEPTIAATDAAPVEEADQHAALAIAEFWSDDPARSGRGGEDSSPVFVTGSVRSGTSALCGALRRGTRYRGFYEGHVLDVAIEMVNAAHVHLEKKYRQQPPAAIAEFHLGRYRAPRFHAAVRKLLRQVTAGYTTPFWVDKTPSHELIQSIPILAETWPNARFIFMKRRGLENMMSRLRKFPATSLQLHCNQWSSIMSDWRVARSSIPGRFLELDQRQVLEDPYGAADRMGELLNLDPLEVAALGAGLRILRAEVTDRSARVVADIVETGWTPEMIETFRTVCGPEMEAYGYTYDARYSL